MDDMNWLRSVWEHAQNWAMWAWSAVVGYLMWLVGGPSVALSALFTVMGIDFACKLVAESVKAGGFFRAIRLGTVRSKKAFTGTALKFFGYFALAAAAHQLRRVTPFPQLSEVLSSAVYMFLVIVELISITENLDEAGLSSLRPLQRRLVREREKLERGDEAPVQPTWAYESAAGLERVPKDGEPGKWEEP